METSLTVTVTCYKGRETTNSGQNTKYLMLTA